VYYDSRSSKVFIISSAAITSSFIGYPSLNLAYFFKMVYNADKSVLHRVLRVRTIFQFCSAFIYVLSCQSPERAPRTVSMISW